MASETPLPSAGWAGSAVGAYLRSRQWWVAALVAVAVNLVSLGVGNRSLPVGVADGVPLGAPLWAYLPIITGVAIAVSAYGPAGLIDQSAARPVEIWNLLYAAAAAVIIAAAGFLLFAVVQGPVFGLATARNTLAWTGFALLAARVIGPRWSWAPGIAAVFVFEWFGISPGGGMPQWWSFAATGTADPRTWILVAALFAAGLAATALTPWHLRALIRRR